MSERAPGPWERWAAPWRGWGTRLLRFLSGERGRFCPRCGYRPPSDPGDGLGPMYCRICGTPYEG